MLWIRGAVEFGKLLKRRNKRLIVNIEKIVKFSQIDHNPLRYQFLKKMDIPINTRKKSLLFITKWLFMLTFYHTADYLLWLSDYLFCLYLFVLLSGYLLSVYLAICLPYYHTLCHLRLLRQH